MGWARIGYDGRMLHTPLKVEPRSGFRIWIEYEDGESGIVDLSDFAGKGVFAAWLDRAFFERVRTTPHRAIAWDNDIELCADALYLRLTGKSVDEVMPGFGAIALDA